jgi:nucleoside phosphorylase
MESDGLVDVAIITALQKERNAFLRYLPLAKEATAKGRTWHKASLQTKTRETTYELRLVALRNMGNISAAIATHQAISVWNPSHIILAGITGGIHDEDKRYLGDVIVGEQVIYYEYGKQTSEGMIRRYQAYRPAQILVDAAKQLAHKDWALSIAASRPDHTTGRVVPQVHFGVVGSGEKVVTDVGLLNELQSDWSQLIGIEMEGAGSAIAAYESGASPGVLLVKGISDWANAEKSDDWQNYASEASATFVLELLRSQPFDSKLRPQPTRLDRKSYSGKAKISICRRLIKDWSDLADYFEIPLYQRARFTDGREPQEVWEWLEQRNKLYAIKEALMAIDRDDLIEELEQ